LQIHNSGWIIQANPAQAGQGRRGCGSMQRCAVQQCGRESEVLYTPQPNEAKQLLYVCLDHAQLHEAEPERFKLAADGFSLILVE
jgi:hypothetical protein